MNRANFDELSSTVFVDGVQINAIVSSMELSHHEKTKVEFVIAPLIMYTDDNKNLHLITKAPQFTDVQRSYMTYKKWSQYKEGIYQYYTGGFETVEAKAYMTAYEIGYADAKDEYYNQLAEYEND